ncbi:MAG TPA: methyltransferase domain-containing protein [Patescibacteria group bacterium]|jgi:SAM-dependent methyltransferase|nr:methyltransferase domain-containing protein [Patescibacteria group bacterium]
MINKIPSTVEQYDDPRLVALYDILNPFAADTQFYIDLAEKLSAHNIIDVGCGTGLLTCELANRGYDVIGVEPAGAMLEVARNRQGGESVRWIQGGASLLTGLDADLVIMAGHVAQVFLDANRWSKNLTFIHDALTPNGYVAFESRNPAARPWDTWTRELSEIEISHPRSGKVAVWHELEDVQNDLASFKSHYFFKDQSKDLVVQSKLRFPVQEEIEQSLFDAGFSIEDVYGNWDGSPVDKDSRELIFIAKRK